MAVKKKLGELIDEVIKSSSIIMSTSSLEVKENARKQYRQAIKELNDYEIQINQDTSTNHIPTLFSISDITD